MTDRHPLLQGVWPPAQSQEDGVLDYTRPGADLRGESRAPPPDADFLARDAPLPPAEEPGERFPGLAGSSLELPSSPNTQQQASADVTSSYTTAWWFRVPLVLLTVTFTAVAGVCGDVTFRGNGAGRGQTDGYCLQLLTTLPAPVMFLIPVTVCRILMDKGLPLLMVSARPILLSILLGVCTGLVLLCRTFSMALATHTYHDTEVVTPRTPRFLTATLSMATIPLVVLGRFVLLSKRSTWTQLMCCGCVFVSNFIGIEPVVFDLEHRVPFPGSPQLPVTQRVLWPLAHLVGVVLTVVSLLLMEMATAIREVRTISILFWAALSQLLTVAGFFWLNILPTVGLAGSFSTLGTNLRGVFLCHFGQTSGCDVKLVFTWMYTMSVYLSMLMQMLTIRHVREATFVVLLVALVTPLVNIVSSMLTTSSDGMLLITTVPPTTLGFALSSIVLTLTCVLIYAIVK